MAKRISPKKIIYVSLGEGIDPLMAGMVLPHLAKMFPDFLIQFNLSHKYAETNGDGRNILAIIVDDPSKKDDGNYYIMNVDSILLDEAFEDFQIPKYIN